MTSLSELKFFTTPGHDCSYLDGKQATTLFADPDEDIDTQLYSSLSEAGFRRSGQHIYRPHCQNCQACIALRIPVDKFKPKRTQKRVLKKNADLSVFAKPPKFTDEYFDLYQNYIRMRHSDGDMYPPDESQFVSFLVNGRSEALFYEFRAGEKLLALAVADRLENGLSAIYTFFDAEEKTRSLGSYAILWLIQNTADLNLPHLYMGYWIEACQKMSYKSDYKPLELFLENQWIPIP